MRAAQDSSIYRSFVAQNLTSRAHIERARPVIPDGASRSLLNHRPFPFCVERAEGIRSTDLDGNSRIDFQNNYTTMIHGHGHPQVMQAVERQLARGTSYSAPAEHEYALASHLCGRIGSVEQIVFNSSGSEAVMVAMRAARAYTGRTLIGKFEGAYHGFYDHAMAGHDDLRAPDDPVRVGAPTTDLAGLPESMARDVVLMRYNDPQAVRDAVERFGDELAAIVVEPILGAGGAIPAEQDFLDALRAETARAGILLICDEVITLRHALGGAQGHYELEPDLTTMAKTIGGGFPVGAVGGSREVMGVIGGGEHGAFANLGTFSANPISMVAGLETMRLLDADAIARLNELGERARKGFTDRLVEHDAPAQVSGAGSLFQVHWTEASLRDGRGPATADSDRTLLMFLGMCNRGVQLSMRGMGALSTPMAAGDIDTLLEAFDDTLREMRADGWLA
jgi:glutamate-1-semialdehyde 2,1-aminomutase